MSDGCVIGVTQKRELIDDCRFELRWAEKTHSELAKKNLSSIEHFSSVKTCNDRSSELGVLSSQFSMIILTLFFVVSRDRTLGGLLKVFIRWQNVEIGTRFLLVAFALCEESVERKKLNKENDPPSRPNGSMDCVLFSNIHTIFFSSSFRPPRRE